MNDKPCRKCQSIDLEDNTTCKHSLGKFFKENFSKDFKVLQKAISHLKIYGYKIEYRELAKEIVLDAYHETRINLTIVYVRHGFLFTAHFPLDKKKFEENKEEIYKTVNEMNRIPDITSFAIDEGAFVAIAWYPNFYTKTTFDDFFETLTQNVGFALRKHDEFIGFLLTKN